ncbi:GNAT family N-acetyltransferase [Roseibium sp. FZY0029]|uniref:GNAT family N-acetyltransferase n=1 Tax=Roseibium sp. FZY0029 TaxID=3116647 RepID=UPI002EBDC840|nr:GNAT family N-acetyltransferase [Roseibium sp. FZY0029]
MLVMAENGPFCGQLAGHDLDVVWHEQPGADVLRSLWASLPGGAVCSAFQAPQFVECFFQEMAPAACDTFGVLAAYRAGLPDPLALLPLIRFRKGPVRIASTPDLGVADQNGPVLSKALTSEGEETVQAVLAAMIEAIPDADVVDIKKLHASIGSASNPFFLHPKASLESCSLSLDADALLAAGTGSGHGVYKKVRVNFRKLQGEGVQLVEATTPEERVKNLEALIVSKAERFKALGRLNSMKLDNREDFYRALAAQPGRENPFKVLALRCGDDIVAVVAMMVEDGFATLVLISIGPEQWHRFSPGMVALVHSIYWARDNNIRNYSFGTGLQDYKSRFGATEQSTRRLLLPLTVKGHAAITALKAKKGLRETVDRWKQQKTSQTA